MLLFEHPLHLVKCWFCSKSHSTSHAVRLLCSKTLDHIPMWCFCSKAPDDALGSSFFLETSPFGLQTQKSPRIWYSLSSVEMPGSRSYMISLSKNTRSRLSVFFFSWTSRWTHIQSTLWGWWMLSLLENHSGDFICRVRLKLLTRITCPLSASNHLFLNLKTQIFRKAIHVVSVEISFIYVFMCCVSLQNGNEWVPMSCPFSKSSL